MQARPSVLGRHLLLDLQVSNSTLLNSIDALEVLLPPCSHTYALVHAFCVACFKRRCKHPATAGCTITWGGGGQLDSVGQNLPCVLTAWSHWDAGELFRSITVLSAVCGTACLHGKVVKQIS